MLVELTTLIIPITLILASFYYKKIAQGDPSAVSGFRTGLSISSRENWAFAHELASKLFLRSGVLMVIISLALIVFADLQEWAILIIVFLELMVLIGISAYVQLKLQNKNKS